MPSPVPLKLTQVWAAPVLDLPYRDGRRTDVVTIWEAAIHLLHVLAEFDVLDVSVHGGFAVPWWVFCDLEPESVQSIPEPPRSRAEHRKELVRCRW